MKTNKGKGYFYSMGMRDKAVGRTCINYNRQSWPAWAIHAYNAGWQGRCL